MTQEDKELLLKDLCARLPYGIKVRIGQFGGPKELWSIGILELGTYNRAFYNNGLNNDSFSIERITPYLRPMSSMTKEERRELCNIRPCYINSDDIVNGTQCNNFIQASECQDWLNANHFDYRGLIEKGLALEAPEGMYKK